MTDLAFLLDAPDAPTRTYPVARLGRFHHSKYGDFAIDPALVSEWQRKLALSGGQVPIDLDHAADRGGSTRAAGWIKGLDLDGDRVVASVEWTPYGEGLVKGGEYRYFSVSMGDLKDDQGAALGPGLLGAALTNRPFFRDLPAVSLDAAAIDNPKEKTMTTLLDSKLEEADALMARDRTLGRDEALRRTGAWKIMEDTLAQDRHVLLDAAAPDAPPAAPAAPAAAGALGSVEDVFAENEGLKAAFAFDLNNQNSEALREHAATLERGGAAGVPEHLSLGRLTVDAQADEARDRARAARLDMEWDAEAWEAHAALGGDFVHDQFEAQRQQKIAELRGAADKYDAFYAEKAERQAARLARFEADEKTLADEIARERSILAAGRPGGLDAGGAPVSNGRIVELEAKLANLRDNRPGRSPFH